MKKLQNNFTTPEQSKTLLELGVPAESADIIYYNTPDSIYDPFIITDTKHVYDIQHGGALPSWSSGRLIEVLVICKIKLNEELVPITHGSIFDYLDYKLRECSEANIIKLITGYISINLNYIDFSKLDEE